MYKPNSILAKHVSLKHPSQSVFKSTFVRYILTLRMHSILVKLVTANLKQIRLVSLQLIFELIQFQTKILLVRFAVFFVIIAQPNQIILCVILE